MSNPVPPAVAAPPRSLPTKALGRRAVATIIDGIIITAIVLAVAKSYGDLRTTGSWRFTNDHPGVYFAIAYGYYFLFEWLFNATIGKAIVGVRVREKDGGRAGIIRVFIRNLLRPIDAIAAYLVGWIVAMISGETRRGRLGDLLGGTYVLQRRGL